MQEEAKSDRSFALAQTLRSSASARSCVQKIEYIYWDKEAFPLLPDGLKVTEPYVRHLDLNFEEEDNGVGHTLKYLPFRTGDLSFSKFQSISLTTNVPLWVPVLGDLAKQSPVSEELHL